MATASCPECGRDVHIRGLLELGQRVRCGSCGRELLVMGLRPLDLYWPGREERREEEEDDDDWDG